jgi:hypothetical protein
LYGSTGAIKVLLQDHCPAVGFIVHQPVEPQLEGLLPLTALGMKGSLDEPVYTFAADFESFRIKDPGAAALKFAKRS